MLLKVRSQENTPGVDIRPAPLKEWLESLPYTNTLTVCGELQQRLRDINQQQLPSIKHFELLLSFNSPFERIHESLRMLDKSADPTVAPQLAILHSLTDEMLMGYKYVINNSLAEKRWGTPKHLVTAVNYAAHLLSLVITGDWQRYLLTNELHWYEASQLYAIAEQKKMGTSVAELPQAQQGLSALRTYPLIAMLRLADPYRMPSELVWEAYYYLNHHINLVTMAEPKPDKALAANEYAVCLHCDPVEVMQYARTPDQPTPWKRLDASNLIGQLELDLKRLASGTKVASLGFSNRISATEASQLLKSMLTQWKHNPERKLPRHKQDDDIELSPGLHAAFQLHNQGIAFDSSDYLGAGDDHEIDLSSLLSNGLDAHEHEKVNLRCKTINRSAGGLAINIPTVHTRLRVGELVTVTPDLTKPRHVLVGSIRWVVNNSEDGQIAGIQYIAKDVRPIAIRSLEGGPQAHFHPALYYRFKQGEQAFELIITTRGMYRPGRMLELDQQGERLQRSCHHLIESNSLFERFSLNPDANVNA